MKEVLEMTYTAHPETTRRNESSVMTTSNSVVVAIESVWVAAYHFEIAIRNLTAVG